MKLFAPGSVIETDCFRSASVEVEQGFAC